MFVIFSRFYSLFYNTVFLYILGKILNYMWYGAVNEDINKDMVCSKSLKSCCIGLNILLNIFLSACIKLLKKNISMHNQEVDVYVFEKNIWKHYCSVEYSRIYFDLGNVLM